jgi:8-oxo-dGTP pyrophosphatase MutT (NUDIX family)
VRRVQAFPHLAADLESALAARPRVALSRPDTTVAAVLVPLLAAEGEPHLLFIRRGADLAHHRGQIAFPGGRTEPGDADAAATALREAHEEIGLDPATVRVLGALDDIETLSTRFVITPIVGLVPHPYPWRPCPREVDAIFTVPLRVLADPGTRRRELWDFSGRQHPVDLYAVDEHVIWGATQRITATLLGLLGRGSG